MQNTNPNAVITLGDMDGISLVQGTDGKISAVNSEFSFDKATGLVKVSKPDGTVTASWQCVLNKSTQNVVLGWMLPAIMQADLPTPDVSVTDGAGVVVGKAYAAPIANFWDVPVADNTGTVTHYAASSMLPDATYVGVEDMAGTVTHYYLTP